MTERRDEVDLRSLAAGAGVVIAGIALAVGAPWLVIPGCGVPASAPNNAVKPAMRAPVQETAPLDDIDAYRREKARLLEGESVDPATGRRHVPIGRAMDMVVEGGAR